jgi:NAD(P)-dependent dehydrogenase (short-subunit alcohol dehydrogenase family)
MSERLSGRVAIVTGAGQGIGRGIALALARERAQVVLVGRTASKLATVAAEISARGGTTFTITADVGSRAAVEEIARSTMSTYGRIDILVNNAQASVQRTLDETTDADVELSYRSGPLGTLYAMQACLPHLKVRGGSIVNFGSSTAVRGDEAFGSYAMAKEAIRGLTRVAAREWGPHDIRVNCICPASLSPSAEEWAAANPERFATVLRGIPLGRMGDPELDIGNAVVALVSDNLRYLTGATLMLEGGRVILG